MAQKKKTYRSKKYKAFIESQPCIIDHDGPCRGDVVAAHTSPGGTGIKPDDRSCLPLCDIPHNEVWHGEGREAFEKKYNVDVWRLVQRMNWAYIQHLESKK